MNRPAPVCFFPQFQRTLGYMGLVLLAAAAGCARSAALAESPARSTPGEAVAQVTGGASGEAAAGKDTGLFREMTDQIQWSKPIEPWPDGKYLTPEITPGGVLVFDYNGDGLLDILLVCHGPPAAMPDAFKTPSRNRLFKNLGNFKFVEIPDAAGLADTGYGHGGCVGDYDNDGLADVFITNYGESHLYHNEGGKFVDVTKKAGIKVDGWSSASSFLDYDRDGRLDLLVVNFAQFDPAKRCQSTADGSDLDYCGPHTFPGVGDQLFHNNGDGTFTEVSKKAGIDKPARGWGCVVFDADQDGWPDILIANDEEPNQLFINQKDGTFKDEAVFYNVAFNAAGKNQANMGIAIGDVDHDGKFDLMITHVTSEGSVLFTTGDTPGEVLYSDKTHSSKIAMASLPYTGWGCGFFDFDHDGLLDLAVANGRVAKGQVNPKCKLSKYWSRYAEPNQLFRGKSNGEFEEVSDRAGDYCKNIEVTRGLAFADLDNDGAIDLVTSTVDNHLRVFRNVAPKGNNHYLMVRCQTGKRDAYGAAVTISLGKERRVAQCQPAYSYLASNDPRVHFGLGGAEKVDALEVRWPDGSREKFSVPGVDRVLTVEQGKGEKLASP